MGLVGVGMKRKRAKDSEGVKAISAMQREQFRMR